MRQYFSCQNSIPVYNDCQEKHCEAIKNDGLPWKMIDVQQINALLSDDLSFCFSHWAENIFAFCWSMKKYSCVMFVKFNLSNEFICSSGSFVILMFECDLFKMR